MREDNSYEFWRDVAIMVAKNRGYKWFPYALYAEELQKIGSAGHDFKNEIRLGIEAFLVIEKKYCRG